MTDPDISHLDREMDEHLGREDWQTAFNRRWRQLLGESGIDTEGGTDR